MLADEIKAGESVNIEFKVEVPKRSEKYIKSVIAFANTAGGKIIIGVDDESHEIVGVDKDEVFKIMDSITNTISDICYPQIFPNIGVDTIEEKCVIVIEIYPGANRPYYLKSKGRDSGTFIRVAGTSRPAHPEKIKELEMEGARIYWDEMICIGYKVTDDAVKKLCHDIGKFRNEMGLSEREVTITQLINWKLLNRNFLNLGIIESRNYIRISYGSFLYAGTNGISPFS